MKKNIDIIFIFTNYKELDKRNLQYLKKNPETKVLQRINISDISKNVNFQDKLVFKINKIADETVFISEWIAKYFIQKGFSRNYYVIYNKYNPNFFYPENNKKIGSIINLVTHHWSNNWIKGFDIYSQLDFELSKRDDIRFTFIGLYNKQYTPKNIRIIRPLYGYELGNELRKNDIYLTAARWEACGMHHVEGVRCGLPVLYHKDGGGVNESCKNYCIEYYNINSLLDGINRLRDFYQDYRKRLPYEFLSIKRCCEEYHNVILNMVK